MILFLLVGMVGLFFGGYFLHKKQHLEDCINVSKLKEKYLDEQGYYEQVKTEWQKKQKDLDHQAKVLQENFNHRWKEVETRINENDQLKHQIFLMKKRCTCEANKNG